MQTFHAIFRNIIFVLFIDSTNLIKIREMNLLQATQIKFNRKLYKKIIQNFVVKLNVKLNHDLHTRFAQYLHNIVSNSIIKTLYYQKCFANISL